MTPDELLNLIRKYRANMLTPEERQQLNAWYASFEDEEVEVPLAQDATEEDVSARLFEKIEQRALRADRFGRLRWSYFLKVAASVCMLLTVSAVVLYQSGVLRFFASKPVYTEHTTAAGMRLNITLQDGTKVLLNTNSRLRYPEHFAGDMREIYLEGEAFFDVKRDVERPFIIRTGRIETTVLGTSFNVRSHEFEKNISVTVVTGKVKVALKDTSDLQNEVPEQVLAILTPDEEVVYDREAGTSLVNRHINHQTIASWRDGVLEFHAVGLDEVVRDIEHWYAVDIELGMHNMAQCEFTGRFQNKPLKEVLDILAEVNGFTYEHKAGGKILISGGMACKH